MILSAPHNTSGQPKTDVDNIQPATAGLAAAARLRGAAVTLAAAARPPGVATAMT